MKNAVKKTTGMVARWEASLEFVGVLVSTLAILVLA